MVSLCLAVCVLAAGSDQHKQHPSHPVFCHSRCSAAATSGWSVCYEVLSNNPLRFAVNTDRTVCVAVINDTL